MKAANGKNQSIIKTKKYLYKYIKLQNHKLKNNSNN